jgi:TonB-linked SusC/RagA family outer membrane protein
MIGTEQQQSYRRTGSAYRKNFLSTNFDQIDFGSAAGADIRNSGNATLGAYDNIFGRATYDFKSKYIFDFNFRYDGSQIFPPNARYGFFPSFQGAWRVSEEDFMKARFPFVDQLKVRATYGELGSDSPASGGGYQFAQFFGFGGNYVFGTSDVQGVTTQTMPNPNFTWEIAKKTDFGIDGSLWKGLLGFEFTLFRERRSGILIQRNFSASKVYGFSGLPPENLGEVENKGYEIQFSHRNKIGKVLYNIRANMQYNLSKVLYMDEVPNTYSYRDQTGRPLGASLLYQADGIFNTQAELDSYPHQANQKVGDIKIIDVNSDGIINQNDQMRFNYNNTPKYVFGMNIDLQYSNFDMNIFLYGQTKAYTYDGAFASLGNADFANASIYRAADRWTPSNPNGTMPRTDFYQPGNSTFFMNDQTFFRLKTLELGYTLPKSLISKIKISNVRVFVSGFNLLTYSPKIKWADPEANGMIGYPPLKVINLGANVRF